MNRFWSLLFLAVPIGAVTAFVLAANQLQPFAGMWLPANLNLAETRIDPLLDSLHWISAAVLLITGLCLALVVWNGTSRQAAARYFHHHLGAEIAWSAVPAVILLVIAFYQYDAWRASRLDRPVASAGGKVSEVPPTVVAVARRFGWDFHHAGRDGQNGTADDVVMQNELWVPADRDVVIELHSRDVIHNFCVPALRIKQDIVPGLRPLVWFRMGSGETEIICTELCGWGHYLMQARLRAIPASEYDAWIQQPVTLETGKPEGNSR